MILAIKLQLAKTEMSGAARLTSIPLSLTSGARLVIIPFIPDVTTATVAAIIQTLSAMRNDSFDGTIPGLERRDEIGLMAQALHQLHEKTNEVAELRAQDDESVRREHKRIRRALQSTRDGVLLADETGEVVLCNPNGELFFGDAQVGRQLNLKSWLPPELAEQVRASRTLAERRFTVREIPGLKIMRNIAHGYPRQP